MKQGQFQATAGPELREALRLQGLRNENGRAWAEVDKLRELLTAAREKLMIYRSERDGEYTGGPEYSHLMGRIDAALKIVDR